MNENITGDAGTNPGTDEKTFTQDQLNQIVSERLQKERQKSEADIVKREQELQQREFLLNAKTALAEKGLPDTLMDALDKSSPEAFEKAIGILTKYIDDVERQKLPKPPPGALLPGYVGPKQKTSSSGVTDGIRKAMGLR